MFPSQPGNKFGPPRGSKAFAGGGLTMGPGGGGGTPGTPSSFDEGGGNPGGMGGGGLGAQGTIGGLGGGGGQQGTHITGNAPSFASQHPSMDAASLAAFDLSEQQQGPPSIQNPEGLAKGGSQPGLAAGGLVPHFEDGGKVEFAKGGSQLGRSRDFLKEPDVFRGVKNPKPVPDPLGDAQDYTKEGKGERGRTKVLKTVMPRC